jgi:hypothetical protein
MPLRYRREIGGPSDGAHQHTDVSPTRNGPVVTTIRVTRRPRIPSAGVEKTVPRSAPAPADGAEGSSIRLAVIDPSAAGPPVPPPCSSADQPDTEETAAWHSEGGHLYR